MGLDRPRRHLSINEALSEIQVIRQKAEVVGAQDYEPGAFKQVEDALLKGKISPEHAVQKAQGILGSKQDYR